MIEEKRWPPEDVWRIVFANFATLFLSMVLATVLTRIWAGWSQENQQMAHFTCAALGFQGATFVLVWWFLRGEGMTWQEAFGWSNRLPRALLLGLLVALGILVMALVLGAASAAIMTQFGLKPEPQQAVQILQSTSSLWRKAYYGGVAILVAPAAEELLFRGLIYPTVKKLGFPRLALWGASLAFAATHVNLMALLPLTFVAVMFTLLYEKTNNLLAPIFAHALFNTANFVLLIYEKVLTRWLESLYDRI